MKPVLSLRNEVDPFLLEVARLIDRVHPSDEKRQPTDNIKITISKSKEISALFGLDLDFKGYHFDHDEDPNQEPSHADPIPADILFSDTVPIRYCRIDRPNDEKYRNEDTGILQCSYTSTIEIFNKLKIDTADTDMYLVGIVDVDLYLGILGKKMQILYPIIIETGYDRVKYTRPFVILDRKQASPYDKMYADTLSSLAAFTINVILRLWYTSQVALLHPVVKDSIVVKDGIFRPQIENTHKKKSNKKKRPVEYIKIHIIDDDVIDAITAHKTNNRHAQCWYVIGHWRTYSSGKKIFIKPHWRGDLYVILKLPKKLMTVILSWREVRHNGGFNKRNMVHRGWCTM